ncbi:HupE/UreJ family protein [Flammeovirga sp. EKP202]|uniref:HupE/UreJ family protein n=1 Tax=Flammeovirga sp. EKP202 TaxID=2770592 RepID=UPI00165ECAC8|nr:HupE/UreJ family protein [Flammeovirga sp. EKP202]MBD0404239.1 HupE/UreJ family protein [Flammeovirga sp. EKP202]
MYNNKLFKKILFLLLIFTPFFIINANARGVNVNDIDADHYIIDFTHFLFFSTIGIIFTKKNCRAVWFLPAVFLVSVFCGYFVSLDHLFLVPYIEQLIILSLIIPGVLLFFLNKVSANMVAAALVLIGFIQGYSAPHVESPFLNETEYGISFLVSTLGILMVGYALGNIFIENDKKRGFNLRLGGTIALIINSILWLNAVI